MSEETKVLEAINTIENFLDTQGRFLATSIWQSHDGTQLVTDWGYFDDGMRAIKKYLGSRESLPQYEEWQDSFNKMCESAKPKTFVADEWYRENFKGEDK